MAWTIDAALAAASLDRVLLSTDDAEIARIGREHGVDAPFLRPPDLAADDTPTLPVLQHAVRWLIEEENYSCDAVVTLQPTSPLRLPGHIDEAVARFAADPGADSLVSCIPVPHHFHPRSVMRREESGYLGGFLTGPSLTRRQDKETLYARNGPAIVITRTARLRDFVFGGRLIGYGMDAESSIDVDGPQDLLQVEQALERRRKRGQAERKRRDAPSAIRG